MNEAALSSAPADQPALWEPLEAAEHRQIATRLAPLLLGVGLLGLGALWRWRQPEQSELAALLQAAAAALVGVPIFAQGVRGFLARPTRDLTSQLVSLAVLAAMATGDFVTATLVPLFMEFGRLFEDRGARGVRAAIEGLQRLSARKATCLRDGGEVELNPEQLGPGDVVVVRPGEVVPVDGEVEQGHSSIDQSPITGESRYEDVAPGSQVFSGTINHDGLLRVRTTKRGHDSVLGRVSALLREVEQSKTPALRMMERMIGVYLPVILTIATVVLFLSSDLRRAIAVLVVACPSALFLCGPVAMVAALTACSRINVLIKSANFLETVASVRTLVFDKTGTVTVGAPALRSVVPRAGVFEQDVLEAASRCAQGSLHPISRAVVEAAADRELSTPEVDSLQELPGQGVVAEAEGQQWMLGSAAWLRSRGLDCPDDGDEHSTDAWVASGTEVLGSLHFDDQPRREAAEALKAVRRLGVHRLVLLTGDRQEVGRRIGDELEFDEIHSELLPAAKLDVVREEQRREKVMMVGDGINDALALSGSDVGVALGARINDVALGGADVALMTDDLTRLPLLLRLARFTRKLVVQNILLVAVTSAVMIALASTGVISPLTGAWLHNVDALLVILNSSRVLGFVDHDPSR